MRPEDPISVTLEAQKWNMVLALFSEGYKMVLREIQQQCNEAVARAETYKAGDEEPET